MGHGGNYVLGDTLASLTVKQFLKLISFLNYSIKTHLLLYVTCFGGGQHTDPTFQYVYEYTKNIIKKVPFNLNYAIASGALLDEASYGSLFNLSLPITKLSADPTERITVNNVLLAVSTDAKFNIFFDELEKYIMNAKNKKTIPDIIDTIHNFKPKSRRYDIYRISNIPLIRLPNTEWFKALDLENEVDIINKKSIIQYLQNQKEFEVKKEVLLVYEPYIPMNVILPPKCSIIPMNTQAKGYFFEKVEKYNEIDFQIFSCFTPFKEPMTTNTFYIKNALTVLTTNNTLPGELKDPKYQYKQITLSDVIIWQKGWLTNDIKIRFKFVADNKTEYYQIVHRDGKMETTLLNGAEQKQYIDEFLNAEKNMKKQFQDFKQEIKSTEKIVQQQVEKGPEGGQALIDAYKSNIGLIQSLENLSKSLSDLTVNLKIQ